MYYSDWELLLAGSGFYMYPTTFNYFQLWSKLLFLLVFNCEVLQEFIFGSTLSPQALIRSKRILQTPVIIWVFIILSLFLGSVTSHCVRRCDDGFHHKHSFQDLSGRACHPDEKESWGFLCLALISLTDAGSANQIQLSAMWAFSLFEETCWRRWCYLFFITTSLWNNQQWESEVTRADLQPHYWYF